MSWDPGQRTCMGVIHGLQANEMSDLRSALSDAKDKCCHPLLVPSLLCQMLVDSDANNIRKHASDLYQVEFKTNYHGFSTPKAVVCIVISSPCLEDKNFLGSDCMYY